MNCITMLSCAALSLLAFTMGAPLEDGPSYNKVAIDQTGLSQLIAAIGLQNSAQIAPESSDIEASSSTNKRSYHSGGYGESIIGSKLGSILGDITGGLVRNIVRSLTGVGVRLGLNLNNEIYNAPQHSHGHASGGYSHNYETVYPAQIQKKRNSNRRYAFSNQLKLTNSN